MSPAEGRQYELYRYARQKFWEALQVLVGDGPMRDRLASAYCSLLMLEPNQVPDELRPRVERLKNELKKRRKFRGPGDPRGAQISSRAPKTGKLAREILDIFVALAGGL